ncbi:membrane protein MLC1 isoform X2 [Petromyzon marinus]|uniref:membrane protein MLC1 isoform X2 n=1 Tax=Petromyzon marinus TaxID=7757 RepID=UPI003F7086F1
MRVPLHPCGHGAPLHRLEEDLSGELLSPAGREHVHHEHPVPPVVRVHAGGSALHAQHQHEPTAAAPAGDARGGALAAGGACPPALLPWGRQQILQPEEPGRGVGRARLPGARRAPLRDPGGGWGGVRPLWRGHGADPSAVVSALGLAAGLPLDSHRGIPGCCRGTRGLGAPVHAPRGGAAGAERPHQPRDGGCGRVPLREPPTLHRALHGAGLQHEGHRHPDGGHHGGSAHQQRPDPRHHVRLRQLQNARPAAAAAHPLALHSGLRLHRPQQLRPRGPGVARRPAVRRALRPPRARPRSAAPRLSATTAAPPPPRLPRRPPALARPPARRRPRRLLRRRAQLAPVRSARPARTLRLAGPGPRKTLARPVPARGAPSLARAAPAARGSGHPGPRAGALRDGRLAEPTAVVSVPQAAPPSQGLLLGAGAGDAGAAGQEGLPISNAGVRQRESLSAAEGVQAARLFRAGVAGRQGQALAAGGLRQAGGAAAPTAPTGRARGCQGSPQQGNENQEAAGEICGQHLGERGAMFSPRARQRAQLRQPSRPSPLPPITPPNMATRASFRRSTPSVEAVTIVQIGHNTPTLAAAALISLTMTLATGKGTSVERLF